MIKFRLLGPLELHGEDGTEIRSVLAQPKRLALLVYLALASPGGFQRRDRLLALFWPDVDEERARVALRQAVRYLRRSLGKGVLVNRGEEELGIAADTLWCDAVEFERVLSTGDAAGALGLYRGDLLSGFHVSDAVDFEHWLDAERSRFRERAAAAAWSAAERCEAAGELTSAVMWGKRAAALAPQDERIVQRLTALLDRSGDRAGAIRIYEEFARRLREEYEIEPSPETRARIEEIRLREEPRVEAVIESSAADPPAADPAAQPVEPLAKRTRAARGAAAAGLSASVRRLALMGAVAILTLAGLAYALLPHSAAPELAPHRVFVAPLENHTGDASLDAVGSMAADWIIQGLSRTGLSEVVPITAALVADRYVAGLPDLTDAAARIRSLGRETGAGTVVSGAFYRQGDTLLFQARITDAVAGRVLHAIDPVAAPAGSPLDGIDLLRTRVLAALAPLSDRRETHARALGSPPTYEAYAAYIAGMEAFVRGDLQAALRHYERSAAADTMYPMPRIAAAIAQMNLGSYAIADSTVKNVARSRDALGPFEAATLDMVQGWLRGNNAEAYEAVVRQARMAPGSIGHYQVAEQARRLNRPREALRVLAALGPERGELRGWRPYWRELTVAHHMLGSHRQELRDARRAREQYPDYASVALFEARALAALGRVEELDRRIAERMTSAHGNTPSAGALMSAAAAELRAHGHREPAAELNRRALTWYEQRPEEEQKSAAHRLALGRALYAAERWIEAEALYRRLAEEQPAEIDVQGYLGTLAARRGDRVEAERIAGWLQEVRQPYLLGNNTYWRACIAALLGEHEQAVHLLRDAIGQGVPFSLDFHVDIDLDPLRGYPSFRELMRHRG
jgi:DNA-binding SARP family transcriptional activator/TolB-like protein